jgi:peptidoglycan hydrolase-like protein with peptidoglycan-binding domain
MNLEGRNLHINLRGDDVRRLQEELSQLGLPVSVSGFFDSITFLAVQRFQREHNLEPTGIVDEETARRINAEVDALNAKSYVVQGQIRQADGTPIRGVIVELFKKRLRDDQLLGRDASDRSGDYAIEYRPDEDPISIFVRASRSGNPEILVTSSVICKAQPVELVNLTVDGEFRGPSELKQLQDKLLPILRREGVVVNDLEVSDVELLACKHNLNAEQIAYLVVSTRLAIESDFRAEPFYALVRQGLPTAMPALVAQPKDVLQQALEDSVQQNIVGQQIQDEIPAILARLQGQIVRLALRDPEPDRPTLKAYLDIAQIPTTLQQTLVEDYLNHEGTVQEFWQKWRDRSDIQDQEIDDFQDTLRVATIALNHLPLVQQLMRLRRGGTQSLPQLLSRLDRDEWRQIVEQQSNGRRIGAPAMFGEDEEERINRYVEFLPRMVESVYPTTVLSHQLRSINPERFAPVTHFIDRTGFEFRDTRFRDYLSEHSDEFDQEADADTIQLIKTTERLFRIAPAFDKAKAINGLIETDRKTAISIRREGVVRFTRETSEFLGGSLEAQQTYSRAARLADTALFMMSQSAAFSPISVAAIPNQLLGTGIPNLEALFGQLDLCQCEHCASVYSPAAYLVDILHFLMNRRATTGRTALDVLFDRRPDLGLIELNCHNTNTPLPYVDLVLEILENAVATGNEAGDLQLPEDDEGNPIWFQTTETAAILEAIPEHTNPAAYNILANAIYPWQMPFDLWAEEARVYLENLGVQRHELMEHFRRENESPLPIEIAAEHLRLSPRDRTIITGNTNEATREFWGLDQPAWNTLLAARRVPVILQQSGLSYEELTTLLEISFINPGGTMRVQFEQADCNVDRATLVNLTEAALDRVHRFVRLQRKLDWNAHELGMTIERLGAADLNDDFLIRLSHIQQLRQSLKLKLEVTLSWWALELDTRQQGEERSLYERIFLDPTINNPNLEDFELDNLSDNSGHAISDPDYAPIVHSALGIRADDLTHLVEQELQANNLTLFNLTRLYQATTLAKALKLSITDYVSVRALTGIAPFVSGQTAATMQFIEQVQLIRSSGFSISTLNYLLRHEFLQSSTIATSDEEIAVFLTGLRDGLQKIEREHTIATEEPIASQTTTRLTALIPKEVVSRVIAFLDLSVIKERESQETQENLIDQHFAAFLDPNEAKANLLGDGSVENPGAIASTEARFNYVLTAALNHLKQMARRNLVVQNFAAMLELDLAIMQALLVQWITVPANPSQPSLATFLTDNFINFNTNTNGEDEESSSTSSITLEDFPNQFATFRRLEKIAIVLNTLKIPTEAIAFLFTHSSNLGWLDLSNLPLEINNTAPLLFEVWAKTIEVLLAGQQLPGGLETLFVLLDRLNTPSNPPITRADFLNLLAERSGWSLESLEFLTGSSGFNYEFPADFLDGQWLGQLQRCFRLLKRLGVSAAEAWNWSEPAVTEAISRRIKQTVRGKYDETQWLALAKPLRDKLRKQQRASLVIYLVHHISELLPVLESPHPVIREGSKRVAVLELQQKLNIAGAQPPLSIDGIFGSLTDTAVREFQGVHGLVTDGIVGSATWSVLDTLRRRLRNTNELYAKYLIDVEMDACMMTSRIKQAISSVQLFIQRCFMNLELEIELTTDDAKEWNWMKNYRVWEANRKVFLYPENWIEPELRDDKTPFFKDLESGLLQDDVNDTSVERELLKYLEKLSGVAQLEISGLYHQREPDKDIVHVIGRSRNTPHLYYYRQWVDQQYWTPWSPVEVDIEGDHLIPVVWNRRLYLFWPIFTEKSVERVVGEFTDEAGKKYSERRMFKYYEIQMAWTEYWDNQWLPKQISNGFLETWPFKDLIEKERFAFWSYFDKQGGLWIGCEIKAFSNEIDSVTDITILTDFENIYTKHFYFSECNSNLIVSPENEIIITAVPPKTSKSTNAFRGSQGLYLITSATALSTFIPHVKISVPDPKNERSILLKSPSPYQLMLAHQERPRRSQFPFFYQDATRTFFVIPQGIYKSNTTFGGPKGFSIEVQTANSIPVELPDVVTRLVTKRFSVAGTTNSSEVNETLQGRSLARISTTSILNNTSATTQTTGLLSWVAKYFQFENFYHPYVCSLIEQLNRHGISGIYAPDPENESTQERRKLAQGLRRQQLNQTFFNQDYQPNDKTVLNVHKLRLFQKRRAGPIDEFDFSYGGAYSIYNWELFFHAPFMLAKQLSGNQRFAEAHRWFHYIFNPTYVPRDPISEPFPERFWQIKPFFEEGVGQSIQKTMLLLKSSGLSKQEQRERKELRDQIESWRKNPFNPHLIAQMRPEAYMKATVMAYLDNLIAWGDQLFRRDTIESINEATQIYILAAEILGDRPREISTHGNTKKTINGEEVKTFNDLRGRLDDFSNILVELVELIEPIDVDGSSSIGRFLTSKVLPGNPEDAEEDGNEFVANFPLAASAANDELDETVELPLAEPVPSVVGPTLFFCIPKNDQLLQYWDTVGDRLFKIRHCMNIEGAVRQLPLFEPPIDPALLVKATAAGVDISSVLNDLNSPLLPYRSQLLQQKALDLTKDVINLGAALLSTLEKKDAEELALLRANHEIALLESFREVKEQQILESEARHNALVEAKAAKKVEFDYYSTRTFANQFELLQLSLLVKAQTQQTLADSFNTLASVLALLPDLSASFGVSINVGGTYIGVPMAGLSFGIGAGFGGSNLASGARAFAESFAMLANILQASATRAGIIGQYTRRTEEWKLQLDLAAQELKRFDQEISAAQIGIEIAKSALRDHDLQIEQARKIEEYMRNKYTNQELYNWMVSQISSTYFQSYQLAYDIAKRAERAFQYELGVENTNFISFGYWDSLKKGLLAGEKLQYDLRRMETAYLEQHKREYEITKHVSLSTTDPIALLQLRETGECFISVPEMLFDLDFPGHYMRRIKSVGLTIPCVTGPYTSVNCTLTLMSNRVRKETSTEPQYTWSGDFNDIRFNYNLGGIQSIATSSSQNDSGLFELNFRDERYLPFEGAGAISEWRLELPKEFRQFDYNTISDVIIHLRYTAREGGGALKEAATATIREAITQVADTATGIPLVRLFSAKHEFPGEWHQFLHPVQENVPHTLELNLNKERFPFLFHNRTITINSIELHLKPKEGSESSLDNVTFAPPDGQSIDVNNFTPTPPDRPLPWTTINLNSEVEVNDSGLWTLTAATVNPDALEDIFIICQYSASN